MHRSFYTVRVVSRVNFKTLFKPIENKFNAQILYSIKYTCLEYTVKLTLQFNTYKESYK